MRKSKKRLMAVRFGIFFVSLLLSLSLLELSLRLGGKFLSQQRNQKTVSGRKGGRFPKRGINVLALGDSFTFGGFTREMRTYPSQLARLLDAAYPQVPFAVTNSGVCWATSRHVLEALEKGIYLNHPDVIVLLVGGSNAFDPLPYRKDIQNAFAPKNFLSRLRVAKLLRVLWINVRGSIYTDPEALPASFSEENGTGRTPWTLGRLYSLQTPSELKKSEREFLDKLKREPDSLEGLYALGHIAGRLGKISESKSYFDRALQASSGSVTARLHSVYFESFFGPDSDSGGAGMVKYLLESRKIHPEVMSYPNFLAYLLGNFELQSRYDAAMVLKELENIAAESPANARNSQLQLYLQVFRKKSLWDKKREEWLEADLEEIVEICRRNGVRLILQNYPVPYPVANRVVERVAARHSLPFVDNLSVFRALIEKDGGNRRKYILDNQHCTDLGHEIMANNVLKILERHILPKKDLIIDGGKRYLWAQSESL